MNSKIKIKVSNFQIKKFYISWSAYDDYIDFLKSHFETRTKDVNHFLMKNRRHVCETIV